MRRLYPVTGVPSNVHSVRDTYHYSVASTQIRPFAQDDKENVIGFTANISTFQTHDGFEFDIYWIFKEK